MKSLTAIALVWYRAARAQLLVPVPVLNVPEFIRLFPILYYESALQKQRMEFFLSGTWNYTSQMVSPCPVSVSSHKDLTWTRWLLVLYFTRCTWIPGAKKSCPQFCIDEVAGKQILGIPLPSVGMLNESTLLERDKYLILCMHSFVENTVTILWKFHPNKHYNAAYQTSTLKLLSCWLYELPIL